MRTRRDLMRIDRELNIQNADKRFWTDMYLIISILSLIFIVTIVMIMHHHHHHHLSSIIYLLSSKTINMILCFELILIMDMLQLIIFLFQVIFIFPFHIHYSTVQKIPHPETMKK